MDWPPSPWRIARCLVSAWKRGAADISESDVWPLLRDMAASPVVFCLPPASESHTRHYMPTEKTTTKVIDAFVAVAPDAPLVAIWEDVTLDDAGAAVLDRLVKKIGYLGRAESWCRVERGGGHAYNCSPLGHKRGEQGDEVELVDVLVPDKDVTLEHLCTTTGELHARNMLYPPSSRMVSYERRAGCLVPERKAPSGARYPDNVHVVRYIMTGRVRPRVTETVSIGDFVRKAAMSAYGKKSGGESSPILSGKSADGAARRDGHAHAFYLPTDEDGDNVLDHMTIVSREALTPGILDALGSLAQIRYPGKWFGLSVFARGPVEDFKKVPVLSRACEWQSLTPFVVNRHPKKKAHGVDKDDAEREIRREIAARFGDSVAVKSLQVAPGSTEKMLDGRGRRPIEFRRRRRDRLPGFGAFDARIEFEEPFQGPLSLGHASHYGLGLFVPRECVRRLVEGSL